MGGKNGYSRVQSGPDSRRMLWVFQSQVFVGARSQMSFSAAIWPRYGPLGGSSTCFPSPFFPPSIFRVNGPSQGRSLTCNSPLMWDIRAACVSIFSAHNDSILTDSSSHRQQEPGPAGASFFRGKKTKQKTLKWTFISRMCCAQVDTIKKKLMRVMTLGQRFIFRRCRAATGRAASFKPPCDDSSIP